MKKLLSILAIFAFAASAFADFDGLPEYVKANLNAIQKYPKASCVLLWCNETYKLNADGSQIHEWHSFRYLPDDAGRDAWGDPHIAYVDGRQNLEILVARIYTRDGRQINSTPHNAFNPIVPEGGFDLAPEYTDFRQMVVTMLGLENGSISELHYRITDSKPVLPWMEDRVYFREEWPVISRELIVNLPSDIRLNYKAENGVNAASQSGTTYTWKMGEQPGYLKEDLAGHRVLLPNVAFTTAADWTAVAGEIRARIGAALQNPPAIPLSLAESLRDAQGQENKLDAVKSWMRDRFNVLELEHPDLPVRLRTASEILNSGYGNSLEMAVLVSALATKAGVPTSPLPYYPFEPPVPGLNDLAGWLVEVAAAEGTFECDPLKPRDKFTRTDRAGGYFLYWNQTPPAMLPWTKLFRPGYGAARYSLTLTFDGANKDTVQGHGRLVAYDGFAPFEKVRAMGPQKYLAGVLNIEKVEITDAKIENLSETLVAVDFRFAAAGGAEKVDDRCVLPSGIVDFTAFVPGFTLGLTKREFPQEIPIEGDITVRMEFPMPEMRQLDSAPAAGDAMWGKCSAKVTREIAEETTTDGSKRRLVIERSLHLRGEWLAPEHWKGFRDWLLFNGPQASPPLVFKKVEKK
ncbi:DUF3857 domain-containing protein [bacterium]|nr:DUF3857 domain-containing protein [bacterium]MBU1982975.1 DUF3857 domain-containing protein [bacterium]